MVISVKNLNVKYKDKHAVKDVSFEVNKGEIFGMIGANGAGKTTIIECIEGLRTKYKGSIDVLGINPKHSRTDLYKRIGVQLQETTYQDKIKVCEIGKLFKSFYNSPAEFDVLLKEFNLLEMKNSYIGKLSGGQRQKLSIILALMGNPDIVFLDEITTGLDPKSRRDIWEKVKKLKDSGITVYMTTHFMEEAAEAERVIVMNEGRVLLDGSPAQVFSQRQLLQSVNLDIPLAVELAGKLREKGIPVPKNIISTEEMVEYLCQYE